MKALEQMPTLLRPWALESTRRAIGDLGDLADEHPAFKLALQKLRSGLAQVDATTSE